MLKKLIGVVAVTTMALVASVSASSAQSYPPPPNGIRCLNDADLVFVQGADGVFQAETFLAGSNVTFTLFSAPVVLGTVAADANGVATIESKIPLDTVPGPHRVEAVGVDRFGDALTLVLDITVVAAQALPSTDPPGGPLPRTGSSSSVPMAQIAVATIVAGGFLLLMSNRRRATVATVTTQQSSKV